MHTKRMSAIAAKEPHYFTGKPCKNGHTALRNTATAECVQCRRDYAKSNYEQVKAIKASLRQP